MKKLFTPLSLALILVVIALSNWCISSAIAAEQPLATSLVVKLKPELSASEQAAVIARGGGRETSSIPALRMHVIAIPNGENPDLILQNYQADPQVERAEFNKARQAEALPNDILYDVQWAMPKIGWDRVFRTTPSGSAIVALLDTGVYANHPDLGGNVVLPGSSMLDVMSDGRTDPNGHGTWLAGIIGAVTDNSEGIAGICTSGVKILPVTVLNANGIGSDGDIIAGIIWAADHGADVILMGFSNTDFSQSLQDAVDYAWGKGAVLVAATGNAGVETPTFPAGARGVIGVSATTREDTLAAASNYGQAVFLAAPGENIYTTNAGGSDLYAYVSGTSASSAVVAGVAAFMKAVDPTLTNGVIAGRLAKSADAIGIAGDPKNQAMFGNGRINMFNALANTDTESILPAGAAPVGNGGPYVGPYTTALGQFDVDAAFSANTSTITAQGWGLAANWMYQYAYESPSGIVTYHPCMQGSSAVSDSQVLASGFQTGTWKVYLLAYNPSYTTCLNNGSATRTASTMTDVIVTTAYMTVASATGTYGGTVTLSAALTIGTPLSGKTITFTLNGSSVGSAVTDSSGVANLYNVPLGTINAGAYPLGIGASFAGDGFYTASSAVGGFTVARATPTITAWPSATTITYSQAISESTLSGGSASVAGSFAFESPTIVPNAGSYSAAVTFTPSNANYNPVSGSVSVTVNKLTPSVTAWPAAGTITYGQPLSASTLSGGSASVEGSFTFAMPTTVPTSGSYSTAVTFTPNDANYNTVSGTIAVTVNKATPTVTAWPTAAAITYGQQLSGSTLSGGSASVEGSFAFAAPITVPNAGSHTPVVTFTPNDTNYNSVNGSVSVTVNRATPTVTIWPAASTITYGQALAESTLAGGSASVAGSFSFVTPTTIPNAGSYSAAVTFTPSDANYNTVSGSVSVTVNKLTPDVTAWPTATALTYGQTLSASTLSAGSASVTGSFSFGMPATVLNAGTYSVAVTFTPSDSTNYINASGTVNINVSPAGQVITFEALPGINFSDVPFTVSATATSGLPVSFNSLTTAVCTLSGDIVTLTGVGACTIEASQQGSGNYYAASPVAQSFTVNPGELDHFSLSSSSNPQTAGDPFSITITAQDAWDHTVTSFAGTADLSTTAGTISPAAAQPFIDGIWTGNVTVTGAGTGKTITAGASGKSGTGNAFDVNPGAAVAFTVTAPAITSAGIPFDVAVTAKDAYDNTATGYTGTVHFTSTDLKSGIVLPADYSFVAEENGTRTFNGIVLETAGTQTITAADTATGSINGTSGSIAVSPADAAKLSITAPATATAGTAFNLTVTAKDAFDNDIVDYTGTVSFTSNDPQGVIPSSYTFVSGDNGSRTFVGMVNLKTSGTHTIAAVDVLTPGIAGTSGSIAINPAAASMLLFSQQPINGMPGQPITPAVGVILMDQYGNVVTGSTADVTLAIAASGHSGTLSGTTTRHAVNGVATFDDLSIGTAGSGYMLTATAGSLPPVHSAAFDVIMGTCGKPASLDVPATNTTGTISIAWSASDVSGATYILEQSKEGGAFTPAYSGTNTSANITVTASGTYTYRVRATKDGYNTSDYTLGSTACLVHLTTPVPASLNVSATSSTGTIRLNWSEVSGATYTLEQSKDGGTFIQVYSGTNTGANITVTANGTYTYRVKAAKEGYFDSAYTLGNTGCVVHLACGAPAWLTVPASNSTGTILITWRESDVSGATYILEQSQDGGAFAQVYSGINTSANITVTANGTYTYRVKAQKVNYDTSDYTVGSTGCVVHLACGAPASMTVPVANSTGVFWISWSASDVGGATYVVEQSKDGGTFTPIYSGTETSVNITVAANGTYTYRVKATKTNYDTSSYTVSTGCAVHLACGAPAWLTVPAKNSTGAFWINWSASDVGGATYVIEQSKDGGTFIQVYSGTSTTANITVTANGTYTYRVKAMKTNYDTSDYTVGSTGCAVHLACGAPTPLTVPATNSTGTFWINWSQSDVSGATYVVEQSKDGGSFTQVYSGMNTSANIAVAANGTYAYRVKAMKINYDTSDWTVGSTACAVHLACGPSAWLTVPAVNSTGTFWVNWSASDVGGVTYVLEQSKDGGTFTPIYSGTNNSVNVTATANGTYTYRVKATKANYDTSDYTVGSTGCVVHLACGAPALLTVPAVNTTGAFWINWSASDVGGSTYIVEQSKDGGTFTQIYSGTNTSVNITVTANGTYSYRVKAMKTNYDTSTFTVGNIGCVVHLACGAPGLLTVPAINSTGTFWINWSPSDVSGSTYVVEQSKDGGAFTQIYSGTNTSTNITVTANGAYAYRIKATKTNYDTSDWTVGNTGCTVYLACGAPAWLTVPPANSSGTFWVNWSASDVGGATYILEQSKDGGTFTQIYSGPNTSTNITLTANGTYTYRVKAMKPNYNTSDYTVGNTGCTVYLACGAPAWLTVPAASSTGTFSVTWSASNVGGATYILEQSKDGGAFTQIYIGTNTSMNISTTANGTYTYRVKAQRDGYDASNWTNGSSACAIRILSKVKLAVSGQPDLFFSTITEGISGMPNGGSAVLTTWVTTFVENVDLDKPGTTLTIGSAFDSSYATPAGPTVIQGSVTVTSGTLVVENLVLR